MKDQCYYIVTGYLLLVFVITYKSFQRHTSLGYNFPCGNKSYPKEKISYSLWFLSNYAIPNIYPCWFYQIPSNIILNMQNFLNLELFDRIVEMVLRNSEFNFLLNRHAESVGSPSFRANYLYLRNPSRIIFYNYHNYYSILQSMN